MWSLRGLTWGAPRRLRDNLRMNTIVELLKISANAFWQGFSETPLGMLAMIRGAWRAGMEFGDKR